MTPEQINLIQRNFEAVAAQADDVATDFYNRLFAMQPVLRLLFPAHLSEQKKKLMATLGLAIKSLRAPEKLIPVLEDLGRRHALYGVRDEYYETVGAALLESLREALGGEFTLEAERAWSEMYGFVAATMKSAAGEMSRHTQRSSHFDERTARKATVTESFG
jgi:hemoglobin-like flavoprotein